MRFESYKLINGGLELGYEPGWHWSKNKGSYFRHQDFFWVHWEIADATPRGVKFHVEAPKAEIDAELNAIKQDLVAALLVPRMRALIEEGGYGYKMGGRVQPEHLQRYKSTEVFRVMLTSEQNQGSHQANIEMVNAALGPSVREVIERFTPQLRRQFTQ